MNGSQRVAALRCREGVHSCPASDGAAGLAEVEETVGPAAAASWRGREDGGGNGEEERNAKGTRRAGGVCDAEQWLTRP